jgi:hypothetical protein
MTRTVLAALVTATLAGRVHAQARPSTDVWVVPMKHAARGPAFGKPVNATHRPGYDNQPSFTPSGGAVLYTYIGADAQADIWRFALPRGAPLRVTRTTESEYSPTVTPDGRWFSVIRVEADSTQRLWKFPLNGRGAPALVLRDIKPVGYHAWASAHELVLFVLGSPATLQLADDRTGAAEVIARNIGRALAKVPGREAVTFLQQASDGGAPWITELDVRTKTLRRVAQPPAGADFHVWTPGGVLLTAAGSRLYAWQGGTWQVVADFTAAGVREMSRLAVSPRGNWLAFVAQDTDTTKP